MRISDSIEISAPPQAVWDYLARPENYLQFMSGVTRWEVEGEKQSGLGCRCRMLIRVGAAEIGGLIEWVEFSEPRDMAWTSVTGIDQRGRFRIREAGEDRSRVEMRYAYGVAGGGLFGWISERVASPTLRRHLRRTVQQLKRRVEEEQMRAEARRSSGVAGSAPA